MFPADFKIILFTLLFHPLILFELMAKSQVTFRKKELEKKKRQKKQEKLERKELNKLNNDKGKTLEELFVYVDEFGNLSNEPPQVKYEFKEEHLIPPVEREQEFRHGKVSYYNENGRYGFIRDNLTRDSVYFNDSLVGTVLDIDQRVKYKYIRTPKGNQVSEVIPEN